MEDRKLHILCHEGIASKVEEYVDSLDDDTLKGKLATRNGVFGYTPVHEAVMSRSASVLRVLLEKARRLGVSVVNVRALNGYTPLHLATSQGDLEVVVTLLRHNADMTIKDDYEKTPLNAAELGRGSRRIVNALRSEELIREVRRDGDRVAELLKGLSSDVLEKELLNKCLVSAVKNDNSVNIGKLVIKGAKDFQSCLEIATREKKLKARAMLLLIIAASSGDKTIVQRLFGETVEDLNSFSDWFLDDDFKEVQRIVQNGSVSTVVAIEMARRCGNPHVREALILKTDVKESEGLVSWHGLRLLKLDEAWLQKISWVKTLRLARNGLKFLPDNIGHHLLQVVKLGLHYNELETIPSSLLQMPALVELNLSHNKLSHLPAVSEWPSLVHLDVSYNDLMSLPTNAFAPYLQSLNLAYNNLSSVPLCVASFRSLSSLNLGYNDKITTMPVELGRLTKLTSLVLDGVTKCNCLPQNTPKEVRDYVGFLNSKRVNAKEFNGLKVVVMGEKMAGKSTLVKALKEKELRDAYIDITDWQYKASIVKKTVHFNIWDIGGEEEHAIHRCFLSSNDLYVAVFDLTKGSKGLNGMEKWLEAAACSSTCSKLIIVGTHLDDIPTHRRHEVESLLQQAGALANSYRNQLCSNTLAISLKSNMENIVTVKDEIYATAISFKGIDGQPLVGRRVASSYHTLARHMAAIRQEVMQKKREPIMNLSELKAIVKSLKLTDIVYDEDFMNASVFLDSVGILTHYNDRRHNLHQVYFLDPDWLSHMLSLVLEKCSPLCKNGVVCSSDLLLSFKNGQVKGHMVNQCLVILARSLLVLPLSQNHILVPSQLPRCRSEHLPEVDEDELMSNRSRHILFVPRVPVPSGFWSTLLQWMLKAIPQLSSNITKLHSGNFSTADSSDSAGDTRSPGINSDDRLSEAVGEIKFDVWQHGLHYSDSEVMFRVEALATLRPSRCEMSPGVLIVASPNEQGRRVVQVVVRSVVYIIKAWFPALDDGRLITLGQKVKCPQCVKTNEKQPFYFVVENVIQELGRNVTSIQCGCPGNTAGSHVINITDLISIFLTQD